MTIGPVPPYQSAAPQQISGLLIGAALTFGIAASQGLTLPAEYTFGTHTAVLVTAEAQKTTRQWRPASGGAMPRVSTYVVAHPAPFDPNVPLPVDSFAPSKGGFLPLVSTFQSVGEIRDPTGPQSVDWNAPAQGGSRPRLGTVMTAGPATFEPGVIQPQTFDISLSPIPQSGLLGEVQWATGLVDPTQARAQFTPPAAPQGLLFSAEYTFGTHAQALYDAEARKSQHWRSARTAPVAGQVSAYQWSSPATLDVIQGWIETPTFSAQGSLVPCQDAGPADLWALSGQISRIAAAPPVATPCPLRMQWASPQQRDSIQGWIETPTFNPQGTRIAYQSVAPGDLWDLQPQSFYIALNQQGSTIRSYAGAPSDPAPSGLAQPFAFTRASAPVTGVVRTYIATLASPSEPYPPTAQSFDIAAGGAPPVVATYQSATPRTFFEPGSAAWQRAVIGPSLALSYQVSGPQPLVSLAPQLSQTANSLSTVIVRSFAAGPQQIDLNRLASAYSAPLLASVVPHEALVIVAAIDNFTITVNFDAQLTIIPTGP